MRIKPRHMILYGVILAVLAAFLIWPITLTVWGGFVQPDGATHIDPDTGESVSIAGDFTLRYFISPEVGVLRDPLYVKGLVNALMIAVCTTLLCLIITLPMASIAAKYSFPGKSLVSALVLVPLILPPFVGAIGLRAILGRYGAINSFLKWIGLRAESDPGIDFLGGSFHLPFIGPVDGTFAAVVLMEALHLYPILYLNITAAMANLDPSLEEAALNLGAGRWKRFRQCTLPLILPGIFAGGTIVFIWSFTELGTPLMFEYTNVTPVQVFYGLSEIGDNQRPYALVVVMLAVAVALYMLGKWAFGGRAYAMQSKAQHAQAPQKLTGFKALGAAVLFLGITALAVMPHLGVIFTSVSGMSEGSDWYRTILPQDFTLEHYEGMLTHELAVNSIRNSLVYAISAMILAIILGLAIAFLTVRLRIKGGWLLDALGMLPLAVPGLVMAFGYVAMSLNWPFPQIADFFQKNMGGNDPGSLFYQFGSLFQLRGALPNPLVFLIVAYTIRRLPYILRSAAAGLEQTSGQLEEAALNLGASGMTALRRIVVPLIMANLIAGGILVFSFAMLEVSDSLILAERQGDYPVTKAIWDLYNRLGDGPFIASAMGVWGMALLTVTLVGASVLMGKKLGAIFRV
ncbi:iron ABC transporter permease [Phycisphaeraceae bacterium D3-23]